MSFGKFNIADLFDTQHGMITEKDLLRAINGANAPILDAMAQELIALMHKYGVYFNPLSRVIDIENFPKKLEVAVAYDVIKMNNNGDLTKEHGKDGFGIFPVNKPSAHQQMAQKALHARLLAEAKDRPEGGAA